MKARSNQVAFNHVDERASAVAQNLIIILTARVAADAKSRADSISRRKF